MNKEVCSRRQIQERPTSGNKVQQNLAGELSNKVENKFVV